MPALTQFEPTAEEREAVAAGALTVAGASEFSGFSESALYLYMRAGQVVWYHVGAKNTRHITRASLIDLMARYLAAHNAAPKQGRKVGRNARRSK